MNKSISWNKKRIIITGASRGLGLALATKLDQLGARVAMVARNEKDLHEAAAHLDHAVPIVADVSNKKDTHRIAAQVLAALGGVDWVFHNASTLGPTPLRLLGDTDCEDFAEVLETNLLGPFRLTKALLGPLAASRGHVVHISSDAAVASYPTWGAYSVSKTALDHLGSVWAAELAEQGVSFLSVDPGEMDTMMHAAAVPDADRSQLSAPVDVATRLVASLSQQPSAYQRVSV